MATAINSTMTRIRRDTDQRLQRLSKLSGLAKAEIVDRAVEAFEPRVVEAAKALTTAPDMPQSEVANETQPSALTA